VDRERLAEILDRAGLDAIVAGSPAAFAYFAGTRLETQEVIADRTAFATYVRADGRLLVTVCQVEAGQLAGRCDDLAGYAEFEQVPHAVLAQQWRSAGIRGRIGYESRWMPAATLAELGAAAGDGIELVPADALYGRAWAVKTPAEIASLERGARATIGAIAASFTPGHASEVDVAADLARGIVAGGAENVAFLILAAGRRALIGHPYPSPEPLVAGDVVRCDVGGRFDAMLSDLARTGVVGSPGAVFSEAYAKVADIHDRVLAAVRPGVPARRLLELSEMLYQERGLAFRRHLVGHNIGIQVHEWPIMNAFERAPLEAGMVVCVEHSLGGADFRLHIENAGVVTDAGLRLFTDSCPWDRPLPM